MVYLIPPEVLTKRLASDEDTAELTSQSNLLTAFSSDGFCFR